MEKIHVVVRFKIQEGKLEEFKNGSAECIEVTKKEPGALLYDWFIDEESMICTVIETYNDSEATLFHVGNVNEPLSRLLEITEFSGEVFGNASKELSDALSQMNIKPIPFLGGIG